MDSIQGSTVPRARALIEAAALGDRERYSKIFCKRERHNPALGYLSPVAFGKQAIATYTG